MKSTSVTQRCYWQLNPQGFNYHQRKSVQLIGATSEVPDDLETSDRYLLLPHKTELDLGKGLALRFAASELPHCYDRIVGFFRHKEAYARFKGLLDSESALERWYKYEAEATEMR